MKKILGIGFVLAAIEATLFFVFVVDNNRIDKLSDEYQYDDNSISNGNQLFVQNCASCHMMDGDAMGPSLGGITTILSKRELVEFIQNPARVISSGNKRAVYLKDKYNTIMPPFDHLDATQIMDILVYISNETQMDDLQPLFIDTTHQYVKGDRVVAAVKHSGLIVELDNYIQIPILEDRGVRKGIATLRSHPDGNGTLFISDQMGVIYKVYQGKIIEEFNIRKELADFIFEPGLGTGLGSFALDPEFSKNGLIYITHAEKYTGKSATNDDLFGDSIKVALQWVLSEWRWPGHNSSKGPIRELLRINTPSASHGAQDLNFAPVMAGDVDYGLLFLGMGDGGSIYRKRPEMSHSIKSLLGTIIRIDPKGKNSINGQYGIPEDNPFAGHSDPEVRKEIWAYGFRNPHRLSWDMAYGKRLIEAEVGEGNIEEVNIIEKGEDYGWSSIEGNFRINNKGDIKSIFDADKEYLAPYHRPFGQYDHMDGKAISGGFVYHGPIRELQDKYIFGDIVLGRLFFMNMGKILEDSTVYELSIVQNGIETNLKELTQTKDAVDLRIAYDEHTGDLFVMTKPDNMIRRVRKAYYMNEER